MEGFSQLTQLVSSLEDVQQSILELSTMCRDDVSAGGKNEIGCRIRNIANSLCTTYQNGIVELEECNEEIFVLRSPGMIADLMDKLTEAARTSGLKNYEPVIAEIKAGLKICPRVTSFPIHFDTKYYDPDVEGNVNVCYYVWNNSPIFYTNTQFYSIWAGKEDEFGCKFARESHLSTPRYLKRFLPDTPTPQVIDNYERVTGDLYQAYQNEDPKYWVLLLLKDITDPVNQYCSYWDTIAEYIPKYECIVNNSKADDF
ncbi:hypothetical protein BGZ76_009132 [Entomortierella beljakovae]|nr:hypothetical protein BGZ76_009132 [Entomortierella beljakovae]